MTVHQYQYTVSLMRLFTTLAIIYKSKSIIAVVMTSAVTVSTSAMINTNHLMADHMNAKIDEKMNNMTSKAHVNM